MLSVGYDVDVVLPSSVVNSPTDSEAWDKALYNVKAVKQGIGPRVEPVMAFTLEEAAELTIEILRPNWKATSRTEYSLWGIMRRDVPPATTECRWTG